MTSRQPWQSLVADRANNVPYFTHKQTIPAGTALSPDPPKLFRPIRVRGLELQNRLMVSPMAQWSSDDGHATAWHLQHLGSLAIRGPSLVWTEASAIHPHGRHSPYDSGLWKTSHIDAWKPVIDFVHSQGQKLGIQLWHGGRKGSAALPWLSEGELLPKEAGGFPDKLIAPSAIRQTENYAMPSEMTLEQIQEAKEQWVAAAKRAVLAGFDAINIHAAHGYLLHEFMSPVANKRTDQYGGSFENRARFLIEVVDEMRAVMPDSTPLFLRISATDWLDQSRPDLESWTNKDSIRLTKLLVGKVDVMDISSGGIDSKDQKINKEPWSNSAAGKAYQAPFAKEIKAAVGDQMLVSAVGNIRSGPAAQELLDSGLDFVMVGSPFLKNPGTVVQFAEQLGVDISLSIQHDYVHRGRGFARKQ